MRPGRRVAEHGADIWILGFTIIQHLMPKNRETADIDARIWTFYGFGHRKLL